MKRLIAITLFVFIGYPVFWQEQKKEKKPTMEPEKIACRTAHGFEWRSFDSDFSDCYYNGATFAEWDKRAASIEDAAVICKKQEWKGSVKIWSAIFKEWNELSCKSFRKIFPEKAA